MLKALLKKQQNPRDTAPLNRKFFSKVNCHTNEKFERHKGGIHVGGTTGLSNLLQFPDENETRVARKDSPCAKDKSLLSLLSFLPHRQ